MAKITIGMVTYNRINTLPKAVKSILQQTFTDWELVLVNDGSTQPEVDPYCKKMARSDPRIKYYKLESNDPPKAVQKILQEATGTYYTAMDDDDYCEPDMLQFLYQLIQDYKADIAICGSYRVINHEAVPRYHSDEVLVMNKTEALAAYLDRKHFNCVIWSKLFKREKLINLSEYEIHHRHGDADIVYKWFAHADKVVVHNIPKYYQVRRELATSLYGNIERHNLSTDVIQDYLETFRDRTAYLEKIVPQIAARARCAEWAFMISMCGYIDEWNKKDCVKIYEFMKQQLIDAQLEVKQCDCLNEREKQILAHLFYD